MASIIGTNGNDILFGSDGDTLTGGGGNDIYNIGDDNGADILSQILVA